MPTPQRGKIADLQTVAVRQSIVHTIDPPEGAAHGERVQPVAIDDGERRVRDA